MKKTLKSALVCAFGAALVLVGCSKDFTQDINNLDSKIAALTSKVDNLQGAIDKGAVVTAVTPTADGIEIALSNGKTYQITNGKNGKDGANGKDGQNGLNGKDGQNGLNGKDGQNGSVITLVDGYWYIDGVNTNLKAQGADGKDGKDGVDGKDGKDGKDGATGATGAAGKDGKDANYWVPDVTANKWVEYTADGKATGKVITPLYPAGAVTAVWDSAKNTLKIANAEGATAPIEIKLASQLKSLAFIPTDIYEGLGLITFGHPIYAKDNKGNYVYLTSSPVTASYRVNPENVDVKDYNWQFINRTANTWTKAAGDKTDLVQGTFKSYTNGVITFNLALKNKDLKDLDASSLGSAKHVNDLIALQTKVDGETITSDYQYAQIGSDVKTFSLIHKDQYGKTVNPKTAPKAYRTSAPSITDPTDSLYCPTLCTPVLQYDSLVVLSEYVETWAAEVQDLVSTLGINPVYKFQLADNAGKVNGESGVSKENGVVYYKGEDNLTNQNKFVTLDEKTGKMEVDKAWISAGRPAINRTPLVKVSAQVPGKTFDGKRDTTYTLAAGYIKVRIVEKDVVVPPVDHLYKVYVEHHVDFTYENLTAAGSYKDNNYRVDELNVTWDEVNKAILNEINKTYEEFGEQWMIQPGDVCVVKDNNKIVAAEAQLPNKHVGDTGAANYLTPFALPTGVAKQSASPDKWATSTNVISLLVDKTVKAPSDTTLILVFPSKGGTAYDVAVKFSFTVTKPKPHTHTFAIDNFILHHNYILGTQNKLNFGSKPADSFNPAPYNVYAGVRIKGKNGETASSIIEHFENYESLKLSEAGSTLTFTIMNYPSDVVTFAGGTAGTISTSSFKQDGASVATSHSTVTFTKAELDAIIAKSKVSPDIKQLGASLSGNKDILVRVVETCNNTAAEILPAKTKTGYYYVVFEAAIFKVVISDVTLKTLKNDPDQKLAHEFIAIVDQANPTDTLYKWSTGNTWAPTAIATSKYGITSSMTATVTIDKLVFDTTGADVEKSFGGCLTIVKNEDGLKWFNMGTDLQDDKKAKFNVKMVIAGAPDAITAQGKVTVLSTEHSK